MGKRTGGYIIEAATRRLRIADAATGKAHAAFKASYLAACH